MAALGLQVIMVWMGRAKAWGAFCCRLQRKPCGETPHATF
jgi:hypothetical protein